MNGTPERTTRAAVAADLDGIMAIEEAEFTGDAWSRRTMRSELASEHTAYRVLVDPGEPETVLGYVGVLAARGQSDSDIQTIAVHEAERGRGLGRLLLETAIGLAAERGARRVFLDVRSDNEVARRLYLSRGFAEIGVRPGYYPRGHADAIVMRLDLADPSRSGDVIPSADAEGGV